MPDPHDTEQDLRDLKQPHPAEHGLPRCDLDQVARRFGKLCLRWGIGIAGGTFLTSLGAAAVATDDLVETHPTGSLFAGLAIIAAIVAGGALSLVGGIDRLIRPLRAMDRSMVAYMKSRAPVVDHLVELAETFDERLAAMERAVEAIPAYGEGVIHGVQLRADALGPERR